MGNSQFNWDKVAKQRQATRRAQDEKLPVLGGRSHRCWCGDVMGHEWYGKYAGLPHPPKEGETDAEAGSEAG